MKVILAPTSRAWADVDLTRIAANVRVIEHHIGPSTQVMAVVKSDAYGHGIVAVSRAAISAGARWLGVAAVQEGIALREAGVVAPIALLCVPAPEEAEAILEYGITAAVGDPATLQAIVVAAQHQISNGNVPQIHLEVDTGMRRSGIAPDGAVELWRAAVNAGLRVTGLMTHLADADGADTNFTVLQQYYLDRVYAALTAAGARFDLIHYSNSAATLRFPSLQANLVRPGLLLYGIYPPVVSEKNALPVVTPALTLKARVATVRPLKIGHHVGYGHTRRLTRPSLAATVLIGYGDGYPRRLSNIGSMLIRGQRAPILGRVCMDQTIVDVTDILGVTPGDEAVCIGPQDTDSITVAEIANLIDTTEHEITTCLTARIPRLYRNEEQGAENVEREASA